jgi:hypothetical protein
MTSGPATSAASSIAGLPQLHDAAQQARNLRHVLQDDKQRIGCFLGAGCPLGIYDAAGEKSVVLIPAVFELTKRVAEGLETSDNEPGSSSKFKIHWDAIFSECTAVGGREPTVEDALTEIRALANRRGNAEVQGMTKKNLNDLDDKICALIADEMSKLLPTYHVVSSPRVVGGRRATRFAR